MKIRRFNRLLLLIVLAVFSALSSSADSITKGKVKINYEPLADGGIKVTDVVNDANLSITLQIDGNPITIKAKSSNKPNRYASRYVRYDFSRNGGGDLLWKATPKAEDAVEDVDVADPETVNGQEAAVDKEEEQSAVNPSNRREARPSAYRPIGYAERIYQDNFFGTEAVNAYIRKADALCKGIESSGNRPQYIIDNDVQQFLDESSNELREKKSKLAAIAEEFLRQSNVDASNQTTVNLIVETLSSRLRTREEAYKRLSDIVSSAKDDSSVIPYNVNENIINYSIVGAIILMLVILTVISIRRKKNKQDKKNKTAAQTGVTAGQSAENPAIVVRRRTTSILKKQCIDDVIDNPSYMLINTSDFTPNSAVRRIYIKNTCIKDVYNLYAEDLRNTENPKEDGCMVLGRWVHNESSHTYDISLEEVVFPGDDAVFKEYELNFGGKIKLRIAEKLRKLRRDTGLQYDLVCWIHSHPGLGVFFSNSDDNVQMQLKHSQHPNFLIAFVVDILTSDQEMGIFTFRNDGSMNSKGDITKMYSLEEMYKWALQSERNSFSHENYFNILNNAKLKMPSCEGVELNNSSIIDLTQIVVGSETGIVGWAVGTTVGSKSGQEFAVSSIVRNTENPGTGVIGCLISMTHMSFPTIQRMIARDSVNLSFVMVYSSKQMSLTTIPVINGELLSDEQFYGDVNIDDLKIWTRRKR